MAERKSAVTTIFHIIDGESPSMYLVDARLAIAHHKDEWRDKPWPTHLVEAYKKRKAKEAAAQADEPDGDEDENRDTAAALDE